MDQNLVGLDNGRKHTPSGPIYTAVKGLSIVVPVFNEEDSLISFHTELSEVLKRLDKPYEIIYIDDGSADGSPVILQKIATTDRRVVAISLRRNYGQTAAIQAGIDYASKDVLITIDSDLQNDPSDIPMMIGYLEQGYDLVHGWRKDRKDDLVSRRIPSWLANRLISKVTKFPIHDLGCTLKAMRREIAVEIELYGEMHRFIPILMHQRGARCLEVVTNHRPRVAGKTKYGIGRTFRVLLDLLTVKYMLSYFAHPMKLFGGIGLISIMASLAAALATVGMKVFQGIDMTGNPLLLVAVMALLAGVQFLFAGLMGELSARIYYGSQNKKAYTIRRIVSAVDTRKKASVQPGRRLGRPAQRT